MRFKRSLQLLVISVSQPLVWLAVALTAALPLFLFRLSSLVSRASITESQAHHASATFSEIVQNPLFAPHKLLQNALLHLPFSTLFSLRLASVVFGVLYVGLFYYILKIWHTRRLAIMGTLLFALSSWFLHAARMGTPDVLNLSLIVGLAFGTWLERTKKRQLPILVGALVAGFLIYTPGFVWFILGASLWQKDRIRRIFKQAPLATLTSGILFLLLLSPLLFALSRDSEILHQFLGWTGSLRPDHILRTLAQVPYLLLVRGPSNPSIWIARLPLLDAFTAAMALLGIYAYFFKGRLDRTRVLASSAIASIGLVVIGGPERIILMLPIIYLLAVAGVALMLQRWFTVFPKNPLARTIGVTLITLAIGTSAYYNLSQYFVAWPARPATKTMYNQQP